MRVPQNRQSRLGFLGALAIAVVVQSHPCAWCGEPQAFTEDVNDAGKDKVVAARTDTPPTIDGHLTDECWEHATRLTTFRVATQPGQGLLAEQQTEVLVTSDGEALYFAFICHDSEPDKIAAHQTQYDGGFWLDDYVVVSLDTFCDRTRSYEFRVNPLGTRSDECWGDWRWDARWQAGAKIAEDGWTVEIAIPFSILKMPKTPTAFGFQCGRSLQRKNERSVWKYTKNYSDREFSWAEFSGFEIAEARRPDRYLAYVVGSHRLEEPESTRGHVGFDWEHPLTSTTTGMLTINPDWSQIEAAYAGVDFTYVERWFPERRPFFVESIPYLPTPIIFYPQRRIYKFDEGLKLTGTEGRFRFGVLGMLDVERFTDVPKENDLAARLWYDFSHETYLNVSEVHSGTDDCTHYEFVNEHKGRIHSRTVAAYYQQSADLPELGGSLSYLRHWSQTEDWYGGFRYENSGDNLQPELGYLSRPGIQRWSCFGRWNVNPKPGTSWLETASIFASHTRSLNHDGTLNYGVSDASVYMRQSPELSFDVSGSLYKHPSPTGEIFEDVTWSLRASLFQREPTSAYLNATVGTIEESRYRNFSVSGSARTPDDKLAASASLAWTRWGRRNERSLHSSDENAKQYGLWLSYRPAKRTWFSIGQRWLKQGSERSSIFSAVLHKQFGVDHDLYVIYGDPQNPNQTVNQVVLKYVMPFGAWGER